MKPLTQNLEIPSLSDCSYILIDEIKLWIDLIEIMEMRDHLFFNGGTVNVQATPQSWEMERIEITVQLLRKNLRLIGI